MDAIRKWLLNINILLEMLRYEAPAGEYKSHITKNHSRVKIHRPTFLIHTFYKCQVKISELYFSSMIYSRSEIMSSAIKPLKQFLTSIKRHNIYKF